MDCWVLWFGYIGEDGYEIFVFEGLGVVFCEVLFVMEEVEFIGFGVWDSLRLEVGFCFYGNDIDV